LWKEALSTLYYTAIAHEIKSFTPILKKKLH